MKRIQHYRRQQYPAFAIGIDLVAVDRFRTMDYRSRFAKNIFTPRELRDCQKKRNSSASLAARFAVKEAVKKTIKELLSFREIEITNARDGRPIVHLRHTSLRNKYTIQVSVTETRQYAAAVSLTMAL